MRTAPKQELVVTVFRREDLARLHVLLIAYESPYALPTEEHERYRDQVTHARLERYVARLL